MKKPTVVCVLWMGEFENRRYSPTWVYRLRSFVTPHLGKDYRFVCLSNVDIPGVETLPLLHNWPGWWSKVEVFNAERDLGERVLYLDLDCFITGSLNCIVDFPALFAIMPPSTVFAGQKDRKLEGVVRKYQASVMAFSPPVGCSIYDTVKADPEGVMKKYRSDQDLIGDLYPDLPTMPAEWFAKARQCVKGAPPECKVVLAQRQDLLGLSLEQAALREAARAAA